MANAHDIKINEEQLSEASFMSKNFVSKEIKSRTFINVLGAEVLKSYLIDNDVDASETYDFHSISKILEYVDIADIQLDNMFIDVRVVFDENKIFIPKKHYELGLVPDVYVVLTLSDDFKDAKLLGFITPDSIDKTKENSDYYFVEKKSISDVDGLIDFVKSYKKADLQKELTEEELSKGREIYVAMSDHDVSDSDVKELILYAREDVSLRTCLLEFDNFEILSHNVVLEMSKATVEESVSENPEDVLIDIGEVEPDTKEIDTIQYGNDTEQEEQVVDIESMPETSMTDLYVDVLENESELDIQANESFELNASPDSTEFEENVEDNAIEVQDETNDLEVSNTDFLNGEDMLDDGIEMLDVDSDDDTSISIDTSIPSSGATNEAIKLAGYAAGASVSALNEVADKALKNIDSVLPGSNGALSADVADASLVNPDGFAVAGEEMNLDSLTYDGSIGLSMDDSIADDISVSGVETDDLSVNTDLNVDSSAEFIDDISSEVVESEDVESNDSVEVQFGDVSDLPEDIEVVDSDSDISEVSDDTSYTIDSSEPYDAQDEVLPEEIDFSEYELSEDDVYEDETELDAIADDVSEESEQNEFQDGVPADIEEGDDALLSEEYAETELSENIENGQLEESSLPPDDTNSLSNALDQEHSDFAGENVFDQIENSVVISNKSISVGEIPIDINMAQSSSFMDAGQLEDLYNKSDDMNSNDFIQGANPLGRFNDQKSKGIVGILFVLLVVGIIGFGASMIIKSKNSAPQDPIPAPTPAPIQETPSNVEPDSSDVNIKDENVVNMDNTAPAAPSKGINDVSSTKQNVSQTVPTKGSAPLAENSFINVKRVSWEIPDYISSDKDFQQYFQSAGKSLKMSLMSDLLLATEKVSSTQANVTLTYSKDGTFTNAKILLSSGSAEVDKIVLQTVNQTLKTLKAPHSLNNNENTVVILKLYF